MRTFSIAVVVAVAFSSLSVARAEDAKNLLFFGNSFTGKFEKSVPQYLAKVAAADGHVMPTVVNASAYGEDLDHHIDAIQNNPTSNIAALPAGQTYDAIVIQGYSTEATTIQDPANDFIPDCVTMSQLLRAEPAGAGADIVLFETWAREPGHSYYPAYFTDAAAMQQEIRANYQLAQDAIHDRCGITPVGDAFEGAGFDGSLYDTDLYHASDKGMYMATLVIYRTLYGETVSDIAYSDVSSWVTVGESDWLEATAWADAVDVQPVPEPATLSLLAIGVTVLARRKKVHR